MVISLFLTEISTENVDIPRLWLELMLIKLLMLGFYPSIGVGLSFAARRAL